MTHYICTGGCDGEAGAQGVCQTEGCKKEGEPLLPCACTDGRHEGVGARDAGEEEDGEE